MEDVRPRGNRSVYSYIVFVGTNHHVPAIINEESEKQMVMMGRNCNIGGYINWLIGR